MPLNNYPFPVVMGQFGPSGAYTPATKNKLYQNRSNLGNKQARNAPMTGPGPGAPNFTGSNIGQAGGPANWNMWGGIAPPQQTGGPVRAPIGTQPRMMGAMTALPSVTPTATGDPRAAALGQLTAKISDIRDAYGSGHRQPRPMGPAIVDGFVDNNMSQMAGEYSNLQANIGAARAQQEQQLAGLAPGGAQMQQRFGEQGMAARERGQAFLQGIQSTPAAWSPQEAADRARNATQLESMFNQAGPGNQIRTASPESGVFQEVRQFNAVPGMAPLNIKDMGDGRFALTSSQGPLTDEQVEQKKTKRQERLANASPALRERALATAQDRGVMNAVTRRELEDRGVDVRNNSNLFSKNRKTVRKELASLLKSTEAKTNVAGESFGRRSALGSYPVESQEKAAGVVADVAGLAEQQSNDGRETASKLQDFGLDITAMRPTDVLAFAGPRVGGNPQKDDPAMKVRRALQSATDDDLAEYGTALITAIQANEVLGADGWRESLPGSGGAAELPSILKDAIPIKPGDKKAAMNWMKQFMSYDDGIVYGKGNAGQSNLQPPSFLQYVRGTMANPNMSLIAPRN